MNTHIIACAESLAALINAPAGAASQFVNRVEPEDFEHWAYRTIYEIARTCKYPPVPVAGAVITQIHAGLLEGGHLKDRHDNGLKGIVLKLTGMTGFPEQLPWFSDQLIEHRFRRAVLDYADGIADHAERSPLGDVDTALAQIQELRRLRARISTTGDQPLKAVREGDAA